MLELGCFAGFGLNDARFPLMLVSILLAVFTFFILKKVNLSTKSRIGIIYTHLSLLFFPVVLYSVNLSCGVMCLPCNNDNLLLVAYSLPSTLIASMLAGFVVIPSFYILSNKKREIKNKWVTDFINIYSVKLNIKPPRVYAVDKAKPIAFSFRSFRSAVFLSIGLLDILNKKELEAVLLHELAHIKEKSSALKFSYNSLRLFSPISLLARFNYDKSVEESKADNFVAKEQNTERYLNSAKRKMARFFS